MSPREKLRQTLVEEPGEDTFTGNGTTNPPPPRNIHPIRRSIEESVEHHGAQLEVLIEDSRAHTKLLTELKESVSETQLVVVDVAGDVSELKGGMRRLVGDLDARLLATRRRSDEAVRTAQAAHAEAARGSSSDLTVQAQQYVQRKLEVEVKADEEELAARVRRNKFIQATLKSIVPVILAGVVAYFFGRCH